MGPKLRNFQGRVRELIPMVREELALQRLLVTETDKNMGTAVIKVKHYHQLTMDLLNDPETFTGIPTPAKEFGQSILQKELTLFQQQHPFAKKWYMPEKDQMDKLAEFRILPKVHKSPVKGRPITMSHDCITTRASKVLTRVLVRIAEKITRQRVTWMVNNSQEARKKILHAVAQLKDNLVMKTFDVNDLYTRIPRSRLKEILICTFLENMESDEKVHFYFKGDRPGSFPKKISRREFNELLDFQLEFTYTHYRDNVYKQKEGIPMGANAAPLMANLFLDAFEFGFHQKQPDVYGVRYLDDLWIAYDGTRQAGHVNPGKDIYEGMLTVNEVPATQAGLVYLDILIRKDADGQVYTDLYHKPGNAFAYPHAYSNIPRGVKIGVTIGELKRILRLVSRPEDIKYRIWTFILRMEQRGYRRRELIGWLQRGLRDKRLVTTLRDLNSGTKMVWWHGTPHADVDWADALSELQERMAWQQPRTGVNLGFLTAPSLQHIFDEERRWRKKRVRAEVEEEKEEEEENPRKRKIRKVAFTVLP